MIKIIITTAFLLGTTMIYAQQKEGSRSTREQIINTENPHNPLVNGIPYDQYKAQVQTAQKQKAEQESEAKIQQKQMMDKQAKLIFPPNPNVADKPKK